VRPSHSHISSLSTAILALGETRIHTEQNMVCRGVTDLGDEMLCQKILHESYNIVMKLICSLGQYEFNPKLAAICIRHFPHDTGCILRLKGDDTRAETRFLLTAKRTSPFKSAGRQFSRLLAAEVCASAVVMLDTRCSEVVRRAHATHSIRQFPLHFPALASPSAVTFQMDSTSQAALDLMRTSDPKRR
jgi:hypothetical protein